MWFEADRAETLQTATTSPERHVRHRQKNHGRLKCNTSKRIVFRRMQL
jgi:hypothetical protein